MGFRRIATTYGLGALRLINGKLESNWYYRSRGSVRPDLNVSVKGKVPACTIGFSGIHPPLRHLNLGRPRLMNAMGSVADLLGRMCPEIEAQLKPNLRGFFGGM